MPDEGLVRKVEAAFWWNALLIPLTGLCSLAMSILIARQLQPLQYSSFALLLAIKDSLMLFGDLGIGQGLSRFIPLAEQHGGLRIVSRLTFRVLMIRLVVFGCITFLLWFGSAPIGCALGLDESSRSLLGWVGLLALLESIGQCYLNVLWAFLEHRAVNLVNLTAAFLQPLLVAAAIFSGGEVFGVVLALLGTTAIQAGLLAAIAWQHMRPDRSSAGSNTSTGQIRIGLSSIFRLGVQVYADKMLRYFFTPAFVILVASQYLARVDLAIFALGTEIVYKALSLAAAGATGWILPMFAKVHATNDRAKLVAAYAGTIQLLTVLLVPAGALLLSVADPLVPLLYGVEYGKAATVVRVFGAFVFLEYTLLSPALAAIVVGEKMRAYLALLACSLCLMPMAGPVALASGVATLSAFVGGLRLAGVVAFTRLAVVTHQLQFPGMFFVKVVGASATIAWLLPASSPSWTAIGATVTGGLVCLLAVVKILRPLSDEERASIRDSGIRGGRWILSLT